MVDYCPKEPSSPDLCASFIYKNKGQSCNLTHLGRRALGTGGGTHLCERDSVFSASSGMDPEMP